MKLGCVVMASGCSDRFGSNKLFAPFCGKPLLQWALDALPTQELNRVVVVTRYPEARLLCEKNGALCLLHDLPHLSDTIRLGIEQMADMDGCLFAVADQPLCQRATLSRLLAAFRADPETPARLYDGDRPGNPVLFPRSLFPALAALSGEQGGGKVLPSAVTRVPVRHPAELMDADSPDTLRQLEPLLALFTSEHPHSGGVSFLCI